MHPRLNPPLPVASRQEKVLGNTTRSMSFVHQELPVHLLAIEDVGRLEEFLTDWSVFDELYKEGYSSTLLKYWRQVPQVNFDFHTDLYALFLYEKFKY